MTRSARSTGGSIDHVDATGAAHTIAVVGYPILLHRSPANPILSARDWPYPAHSVFNAGATLLPDGTTLLLCRVEDRRGHSHLCAARSRNGVDGWVLMLAARKGAWWDANKVGLSPPLIETARGWLMLYHGVRHTAAGCLYRLGLALFALDEPERCLKRGDSWMFGPEESYERDGDVGNVTFPCGYTIGADGDTIRVYYGAGDTCVALATGSISELLGWLDENASSQHS